MSGTSVNKCLRGSESSTRILIAGILLQLPRSDLIFKCGVVNCLPHSNVIIHTWQPG